MTPFEFRNWAKALSNFFFCLFVIAIGLFPFSTKVLKLEGPFVASSFAVAVTMLVLAAQITAMYRHWVELTEKRIKEESVNESDQKLTQIAAGRLPRVIFKSPWFVIAVSLCLIGAFWSGSRVVRERFAAEKSAQFRQSESLASDVLRRMDQERARLREEGKEGRAHLLASEHGYITRTFSKSMRFIDQYTLRQPGLIPLIEEERTLVQDLCRDLATVALSVCVDHQETVLCEDPINGDLSVSGFLEDLNSAYCPTADDKDPCCTYVNRYLKIRAEIEKVRATGSEVRR
ncbi:MAG: hypothetical protein IT350_15800 [Deltaproteobacteria bacterium]|nr:hypothetical protein [Deltaproteobacteria bacterium]